MNSMSPNDALVLASQLSMGFALSATCGLRAFLPLFAASVLSHLGYFSLGDSFVWMSGVPAMVVFGSAVVFELVGDKFPAVDHALDAGGLVVKPAAATLLAASMFTHVDPLFAAVLGLVTGGVAAGGVHLVKTKTRLASSLLTMGFGNPVLSILEDLAAFVSIVLAVLLPLFAAMMILGLMGMAVALAVLFRDHRISRRGPAPVAL